MKNHETVLIVCVAKRILPFEQGSERRWLTKVIDALHIIIVRAAYRVVFPVFCAHRLGATLLIKHQKREFHARRCLRLASICCVVMRCDCIDDFASLLLSNNFQQTINRLNEYHGLNAPVRFTTSLSIRILSSSLFSPAGEACSFLTPHRFAYRAQYPCRLSHAQ